MASVMKPSSRHRRDDLGGALARPFGIAVRREFRRRLHQAGEHGGLGQGDVFRAMAEIFLRRRFDAIGAGAEIDAVEVELENLVFRIFVLQPDGEDRLLDFARERALLRQEQVLGELLGQRRAALHRPARCVARQRPHNAEGIDAPMRIETAVLDRDERLRQIRRQISDAHRRAADVAAVGEQRPVIGQNGDIGRALRHGELIDRRQFRRIKGDDARRRDARPDQRREQPRERRRLGGAAPRAPRPAAGLGMACVHHWPLLRDLARLQLKAR